MSPDINPIYAGLEKSCPRDSKTVSYVESWGRLGWLVVGLSKNLVKPLA